MLELKFLSGIISIRLFFGEILLDVQVKFIQCYRIFDLGHEVDLKAAQARLSFLSSAGEFQFKRGTKSVLLNEIPLLIYLDDQRFPLSGFTLDATLSAKMWNFGALSLCFKIAIPQDMGSEELVKISEGLYERSVVDDIAKEKAQLIMESLGDSIRRPLLWDRSEEYQIFVDRRPSLTSEEVEKLITNDHFAQIMLSEGKQKLSNQIKNQLRTNTLQYSAGDVLTVDWNCAYLASDGDISEICDVIEFANIQLLELRYYDSLLDKKLSGLFKELMNTNTGIFNTRYSRINREASQIYLEASDVVDKVENSLKVVGDVYYARVFLMTTEKLKLHVWQRLVDQKLKSLLEVSNIYNTEVNNKKSHFFELIIITLIAVELIPIAAKVFYNLGVN